MDDTINTIRRLLAEVLEHLQAGTRSDRSAAAVKLHRIAALSSTLAFTVTAKN